MSKRLLALALFVVALAVAAQDLAVPALKLSGYYKNLLVQSETVFPAGQSYDSISTACAYSSSAA
jgi:hypothetical protein